MSSGPRVVIIGAGHAGGSAAGFLRQYGFEGPIVLVGEEPIVPYQRPPLSKAWLKGEADADSLSLKPAEWYAENGVDLRLNTVAASLNRGARTVTLNTGETLQYDVLVLATGARARKLPIPGADLKGVLELRTAADAEDLKAALGPDRRLAVIGGGYVGLEAAASARALGSHVMVIEREPRVLARVACEVLSNFFQDYHRAKGVKFELGAGVQGFEGEDGQIRRVVLSDGRKVDCDAALVGVGAMPNVELAKEAGLACADGVIVDLQARTSDPAVFAIGDVTHRPLPLYDRNFRLESVPNALEQAKQVACDIVGRPAPAPEVPWFWSDQYDLKMQIAGIPFDADSILVRGDPASAKFAVFHLKGDLIQAVEAVNAPPEYMAGRQLIGNRKPISREKLANPAISMKEVAA
ncbi:3-phenylpropionate/trans-cinnamate dioxygenase ferredoxin reductase subunit [Caulobacter ginsengisoli]|uniref:3-phenylpropionate/trans-cinnamate dioxygenase ferredoxin reductase subunit n=1 Tax=Caulobacter ginsengisoli TaxID=400775 RepID=A0ABU0IXU9_9CAUL|nr:FAD-dependent oxidoreductase [Caulobacter ginsengisoli]MDQ0466820.1 3-phenylpropionate/trans-cinnamate dioxygenase ferredoxin reductase subunit [Caulobacter ginsengisoli]